MIRTDIRKSKKVASLGPESLALFCLLIPHFNAHGKMNGDPNFIKGEACPLVAWLTIPRIKRSLTEISDKTNVKWFQLEGLWYLHALNWNDHQELREDRKGQDGLPSYKSGTTPGEVPREGEVEGKGEGEVKVEDKGLSRPPANQTDDEFLASLLKNPAYQGIDIQRELSKMDAWLSVRPEKKKTRRFIVNWLNRADKEVRPANGITGKTVTKLEKIRDFQP